MATLEKLQDKKRELEEKLEAGDLAAEPALARVDAAIAARTKQIQHSRKRMAAVKEAVKAGVPVAETKKPKCQADVKKSARDRAKRPLNRFE